MGSALNSQRRVIALPYSQANPYTVSGFGVPRRQPRLRLARGVGAAHGAYGGILSRSGVPLRLFAERQALHQAARASRRGLRSLRASAESEWRGWQGEHLRCIPMIGGHAAHGEPFHRRRASTTMAAWIIVSSRPHSRSPSSIRALSSFYSVFSQSKYREVRRARRKYSSLPPFVLI